MGDFSYFQYVAWAACLMGLRSYIVKRLIYSVILIFIVIGLNYVIFFTMPGDPYALFINPLHMTREQEELIKQYWGYYDPHWVRLLKYINNLLHWDFGKSITGLQPVADALATKIPWTLILVGGSTVLAVVIGVILGVIVAHKRGGPLDTSLVVGSLVTMSLPTFWMGYMLILIFTLGLGWFPHALAWPPEWGAPGVGFPKPLSIGAQSIGALSVTFQVNPSESLRYFVGYVRHAFLPILTLTLFQYGAFLLLTRATMMEALTEDYIVTARAKGVGERTVLFKHALKNASLPIITQAALYFGSVLGGAIITETVFSWPGVGGWIFEAIVNRNYPVLMATFYILALSMIIAVFIADILYGFIDPRIHYG
jgi:peptide/nickel transport system permease protein